jgi:uncharacterized protein
MCNTPSALPLLHAAATIFDAPEHRLAESARLAWKRSFVSGGDWMRMALGVLRNEILPNRRVDFSRLGWTKYGLASGAAALVLIPAVWLKQFWLLLAALPVFYAAEAQMAFLFPLALDGFPRAISESRRWTRRAGGTWRVMKVVMPIAASMIFGGFLGRGFVRSWCLGCVAVLIWYEQLRKSQKAESVRPLLEIGPALPLLTRCVRLRIFENREPVRLLYATDLHCRGESSRRAPLQLVRAARENLPDLIVLGGDLADARNGLPLLAETVRQLRESAPVWAIAGNHDQAVGLPAVKAVVESAGGNWLGESSVLLRWPRREPFYLDGAIPENDLRCRSRILCAHNPKIFPAAAARGYPLVLAGHLHGGQFVFAERRGRLFPGAWFYRWNGTLFELGESTMLVSRGVSDTLPLRWNCPREILLCEIY